MTSALKGQAAVSVGDLCAWSAVIYSKLGMTTVVTKLLGEQVMTKSLMLGELKSTGCHLSGLHSQVMSGVSGKPPLVTGLMWQRRLVVLVAMPVSWLEADRRDPHTQRLSACQAMRMPAPQGDKF